MNEQLRLIVELQEMDTAIIRHSRTIKSIPLRISEAKRPLAASEESLKKSKAKFEAAEKKKREKEQSVEESKDRIKKLKARTGDIKDNKAYQAHLKEIETLEKQTFKLEDEILSAMEAIESERGELKKAEAAHKAEEASVAEFQKKLDEEVKSAEKELDIMKALRTDFVRKIDSSLYARYRSLITSLGGLAVTEVRDEICGGCNMNIMPQLYVEIKRGEGIISCPQCKRIMFYREGAPEASES